MSKGFWDFMSDWMNSPAFRYYETDEQGKKKKEFYVGNRKKIRLLRGGKEMIVDVDSYELIEDKKEATK